jgi:uncharacterized protein CbrC (UPF0167 family)
MKAEDIEVLEVYERTDGHRDWGRCNTWLHPGDIVCLISGESATEIQELIREHNKAIKERDPSA